RARSGIKVCRPVGALGCPYLSFARPVPVDSEQSVCAGQSCHCIGLSVGILATGPGQRVTDVNVSLAM
ncbi:hypothetical protein BaRGS_00032994, partial [Batillaria attramentaria]